MIPKIIHYCWFGRNPKPDIVLQCIESWKKYCPDWQIIEWNEDNFDINAIPYMKEAYESKKWAFVTDVARLILVEKGGIYLDTDVELLKNIDYLLNNEAFFVFESTRNIATGLGFGACPENKCVTKMLEYYEGKHFLVNGKPKMIPCPAINTEALILCVPEIVRNGKAQKIDNIRILSQEEYVQCAKHHGTASWVEGTKVNIKPYRESAIKDFLREEKCFRWVEKIFGKRVTKLYTFVVYDIFEVGIIYYLKRFLKRILRK